MTLSKLLSSAFHTARARFGNTGILAATIYRNSPKQASESKYDPPPDPKSRGAITDSGTVELAARYAARKINLFPLGDLVARQDAIIANTIFEFFQGTTSLRHVEPTTLIAYVGEFRNAFLASPFADNEGGLNFGGFLNVFLIARCLAPKLIVESGAFKGASSYFLKAACPNARVLAFDPVLSQLTYHTPEVTYHGCDWRQLDVRCDPIGTGLCFFDDHQNQAARVAEAYQRGFRHLIFDDSWPIEVPGCGWPPIPTIDMVVNNTLKVGDVARWVEDGKLWTYEHTSKCQQLMEHARSLIKGAYDLPFLYRQTGVPPTSVGKLVELV